MEDVNITKPIPRAVTTHYYNYNECKEFIQKKYGFTDAAMTSFWCHWVSKFIGEHRPFLILFYDEGAEKIVKKSCVEVLKAFTKEFQSIEENVLFTE